jgi:hypothetical protein
MSNQVIRRVPGFRRSAIHKLNSNILRSRRGFASRVLLILYSCAPQIAARYILACDSTISASELPGRSLLLDNLCFNRAPCCRCSRQNLAHGVIAQ